MSTRGGAWLKRVGGAMGELALVSSSGLAAGALGRWLLIGGRRRGVFSFGDANFYGSLGGEVLASPIIGSTTSVKGDGYWIARADGTVFNFGDAESLRQIDTTLNAPVVAMAPMD